MKSAPVQTHPSAQATWKRLKSPCFTATAILALTAIYFLAGKFGLSLASVNASASPVWPPTGLALAALLLWGSRLWPGVFLGAFLVNVTTQGSAATSLGIALGNTLEALVAVGLVRQFAGGLKAFDRAKTIFIFVALAAVVSTAISASFGVSILCLGGFATWDQYPAIWLTWWLGDMMSQITIAPLLVIWLGRDFPRLKPKQILAGLGLLTTLFLAGEAIFAGPISFRANSLPLEYLAIPPLLWAAFQFGQRGAITSAVIMSSLALWGTRHGSGPFATADPNSSLLLLQTFMGTITLTALVLAAVISERQRAEQRLQVQDAVSRVLAESPTLTEATPKILQALCEGSGWEAGAIWRLERPAGELACVELWHAPSKTIPEFEALTRQIRFAYGIGLPGRAWSTGRPIWVADVTKDPNVPRAAVASKEGLRAAFCFPLKLGEEVVGAVDGFSTKVGEPDEDFLQMLGAIGSQLGQFIERKKAENALREAQHQLTQHAQQLEATVVERTAKLSESNADLEAFSYSLSHDMRAPLRAIHSFTRIVLDEHGEKIGFPGTDYLTRAGNAAARLDRLIQDVLAVSRLSRQQMRIEPVNVEQQLVELIHERQELQAPKAEIAIERPLLVMRGHEPSLMQCLSNLLGNAVKFVSRGVTPRVRIYTVATGSQVRLWIEDNGIGIEPEAQHRVFEMFQRLHSEDEYEGTGIGLAIVRKAMERMGGQTGVESEPGYGSRFWLELPGAN